MKNLRLVLLLLIVASTGFAQPGKPTYGIDVFQNGFPFGTIDIELWPDIAPLHVRNFDSLVSIGFYDSTAFHRVVPGFVIQGGDPNSRSGPVDTWGYGDPSQTRVPAEFSVISHRRGILSAARAQDINSATSQFFIVVKDATYLDEAYSVYGRVTSGMDIVDSIVSVPVVPGTQRPVDKITMVIRRTGTDESVPEAPVPTFPSDDTTRVGSTITLRWTGVPSAILYEVQVARDSAFTDLVKRDSVTATRLDVGNLKGFRTYYWRVRASNGGLRGPYSDVRSFTTAIGAPTLVFPASASAIPLPVPLAWGRVEGATSYRLQLGTNLGLDPLILDSNDIVDTSVVLTNLAVGQRYFWRVLANGDGYDVTSARWNFTVAPTTGVADELRRDPIVVATEIAAGNLNVSLNLQQRSFVRAELIDMRGIVCASSTEAAMGPGPGALQIDLAGLSRGAYLLRVDVNGRVVVRSVGITR